MTTYEATIPGRHASTHKSEAAAKRAIAKAEKAYGVNGTVRRVDNYPHYKASFCVYGFFGVGEATR